MCVGAGILPAGMAIVAGILIAVLG